MAKAKTRAKSTKAPEKQTKKQGNKRKKNGSKNYVIIDTNVLLIDPYAYLKFKDYTFVVPFIVIEEIDSFKREMTPIGKASREFIRTLDDLRSQAKLTSGVKLENGGELLVYVHENLEKNLPPGLDEKVKDNYILSAAIRLQEETNGHVKLVTKDADLRIKADVLNIEANDYHENSDRMEQGLYTGWMSVDVSDEEVDELYNTGNWSGEKFVEVRPAINQYVFMRSPNKSGLGRYDGTRLMTLIQPHGPIFGIQPRNREQRFAFDALLDPEIRMVTIAGKAGTGKTLLAIACGLDQVVGTETYSRLLVARPIIPMGRDLGALPGELSEKMAPWMQPIFDNLEFLLGVSPDKDRDEESGKDKKGQRFHSDHRSNSQGSKGEGKLRGQGGITTQYLMQSGLLAVEPLTYIRGRSMPEQYLIVDEAQNLTPHEARTIITRAGEGTKVVFTGDFFQIDHPYLNIFSNGLSYTFEAFRNQPMAAHITLEKGERSELAELAAKLMP